MRTLGLIGGMSWESTASYYKLINEGVRDSLGPLRSASVLLYSYDFERIKALQHAGRWDEAGRSLADVAVRLEREGAEALVLCTNTMHKVADMICSATAIPFLHLADCTAERIIAAGLGTVGLLGTRFTMEEDFYKARLRSHGLEVVVPDEDDMTEVHRVIYDELCRGIVRVSSRERYGEVARSLARRGAQGIILGCTEITILIGPEDLSVPSFDTTAIHADAAVRFAVADEVSPATPTATNSRTGAL